MKKKLVDITPGICGDNSHHHIMEEPEEGMAVIDGTTYYWYGGCPQCVREKLKELEDAQ